MSTEDGTIFLARVDQMQANRNNSENSELVEDQKFFSFDEVYQMLLDGKINDAFTGNAVQLAMYFISRKD